ncbi:DUF1283 family protein [Morganella psychrotolerans]|uniref:DUF1283 family protein n=1 Tax=Morganella psychrotolerans TaxID=368603 RepID=A0A1B8H0R2_9GAMM|nr:DUF1283 family protein [Morganella psychrotolerans]OBU02660.1 hypothetical protein AYY18_11655 [Morganella psychrotolerans]
MTKSILTKWFIATAFAAPLFFAAQANAVTANCSPGSTCVVSGGDTALEKERARQEKEQWDDTRSLRQKVNRRAEKEFDKGDRAIDVEDACLKSSVVTAYWEPNTQRCLDANTGREVTSGWK